MDTARVNICYRPLRIAWAIRSDDRASFARAVSTSHTMWGGRFNPIVMVDRPEAADLVELFRADMIVPVGDSPELEAFGKRFPHLINPFFEKELFFRDPGTSHAQVLDIHNALVHWREMPEWKDLVERGIRRFLWDADDPLADVFNIQYGMYPSPDDVHVDYWRFINGALEPAALADVRLEKDKPIPLDVLRHVGIAFLSRWGLGRHYTVPAGWDHAGVFIGDASDLLDVARFWNLRAADISLQFVDPQHLGRYSDTRPEFEKQIREGLAHLPEHQRNLGAWSNRARLDDTIKLFPEGHIFGCGVDEHSWQGGAIRPPMMIFGEESSLGVVGEENGQPRVSFALKDKPFAGDFWFHGQHLVASVSMIGGVGRHARHTFLPPYVPELHEFYARTMHFRYSELRIEPERVGLVIDANENDLFLSALPVEALSEKLFDLSGLQAKPSSAGLVTRQLVGRLGGVDGARPFKIPGVRRLLKTHGLRASFTKGGALQLIGNKDPENPTAKFSDHLDLFIEERPWRTKLTPEMVFGHLVEKGLFRIGAELVCPTCQLPSWIALDELRQRNVCELCGGEYDGTRQLVGTEFRYRRSGVLGIEKNAQGAIPVALLLQQLSVNVDTMNHDGMFLPSFDLTPKPGVDLPTCETDFFVVLPRTYPRLAQVIIGECKDKGGKINEADVENMRRIADAFPQRRFEAFILFAKLSAFSPEEIALAKTLNSEFRQRVVLLTDRELEPYHLYERTEKELGIKTHGGHPSEMARTTAELYFK